MDLQEYKKCLSQIELGKLATLKNLIHHHSNIIILGNGGSNAVALHIAEDYHKMLGVKTITFGDTPRMSCYANKRSNLTTFPQLDSIACFYIIMMPNVNMIFDL